MSMQEWAKREVEIACKRERAGAEKDGEPNMSEYGCGCYDSALKAFNSLCEDGHSGMSIGFTKNILNRLIDGKPLTPIEDTEDVWNQCNRGFEDPVVYQCKRMSSLFKDVYKDGRVDYHSVDAYYCEDKNTGSTYTSGLEGRIHRELYPITMPYMPPTKRDKIVCEECLTDLKNGDYDTKAILYIVKPDGTKVDIYRYFKEADTETGWQEISANEWEERQLLDKARKEKLAEQRAQEEQEQDEV